MDLYKHCYSVMAALKVQNTLDKLCKLLYNKQAENDVPYRRNKSPAFRPFIQKKRLYEQEL